jgi:hypothetical protein
MQELNQPLSFEILSSAERFHIGIEDSHLCVPRATLRSGRPATLIDARKKHTDGTKTLERFDCKILNQNGMFPCQEHFLRNPCPLPICVVGQCSPVIPETIMKSSGAGSTIPELLCFRCGSRHSIIELDAKRQDTTYGLTECKPNDDLLRVPVYRTHLRNLMVPLRNGVLIYAEGVEP